MSQSATQDQTASCLCPLLPPSIARQYLISLSSCRASVHLDPWNLIAVWSMLLSLLWFGSNRRWTKSLSSMLFSLSDFAKHNFYLYISKGPWSKPGYSSNEQGFPSTTLFSLLYKLHEQVSSSFFLYLEEHFTPRPLHGS